MFDLSGRSKTMYLIPIRRGLAYSFGSSTASNAHLLFHIRDERLRKRRETEDQEVHIPNALKEAHQNTYIGRMHMEQRMGLRQQMNAVAKPFTEMLWRKHTTFSEESNIIATTLWHKLPSGQEILASRSLRSRLAYTEALDLHTSSLPWSSPADYRRPRV